MTDIDPFALERSLAELERRTHRLRALAMGVLFVLLLISFLTLAFTISTDLRMANLINRDVSAGADRGREIAEARKSVEQMREALARIEAAAGIATPTPEPSSAPSGPQPTPEPAPPSTRTPRARSSPRPAPSPTPTPMCVLQFCA